MVSITMKRHYDNSNSNKEKHLTGTGLQFRGLDHYYHSGIWWRAGRHGAGEGAEIPTSCGQQEVV